MLFLLLPLASCTSLSSADETNSPNSTALKCGAIAVDVSPTTFPVIVNGMFEERTADKVADRLHARAFVLASGSTKLAIVVVDSCMLPRELLDEAKTRAAKIIGIPTDHILISATHTHSAPASMGCLGSRPDPAYPKFLIPQLVRAIQLANERLQPAQIGWASTHAPKYTYCRRYIRRPDRLIKDPFGELNVRANMHPGFLSPDAVGPSGPVDDELSLLAVQTIDGKPLAVLANFSMHYIGSPMVSSDYFGRFAEHLGGRLDGSDGSTSCIVAMSQGTSGDLASMDYSSPTNSREYDRYAADLAEMAESLYRQIKWQSNVPLAMQEAEVTLRRRTPDAARLKWAQQMAKKIGDRLPKGQSEVYALEQIMLAAEPERGLKLQALRIGDLGITAIPNEVFALTGLKLKRQSPFASTFNIELANGAEGYIPPPEQHELGGYTTWPARTAGLEECAEPKITEILLNLLERVAEKPRRPVNENRGRYATTVLASKPCAYWRLCDMSGNIANNLVTSNQANATTPLLPSGEDRRESAPPTIHTAPAIAIYESGYAHYLAGPPGNGLSNHGETSHATHFAGGRLHAHVPSVSGDFSVELWLWNGLPNDARPVTGYLFSHGPTQLGIGGTEFAGGHLFISSEREPGKRQEGHTKIEPRSWNHLALVRESNNVRIYLNGLPEPEIIGEIKNAAPSNDDWFFAGRNDKIATFEGKLSDVAVYDRALTPIEIAQHTKAAKQ
jgi:hypothetical protein